MDSELSGAESRPSDSVADDVIFMSTGGDLVPLAVAPYEAESVLQGLLEKHPQLLAGAQMNRAEPPRFLLVRREAGVADREDGAGRWSLDHLFLDQWAIPTMVEVKRSSDTRVRREVVGQMLDYAANALRYWPSGHLQVMFEETCVAAAVEPDERLLDLIGPDADAEEFWTQAESNLRAGKLRLLFVADVIPTELRAIIEFLNAQMSETDVYGVEVRRYAGGNGVECLVPRLVGKVVSAEAAKRGRGSERLWDEDSFFEELRNGAGEEAEDIARHLLQWSGEHGMAHNWGAGAVTGTMTLRLPGATFPFLIVQTKGRCSTTWGWPKSLSEERRNALTSRYLSEIKRVLGVSVPPGKSRPIFHLSVLNDPGRFDAFCGVIDEVIAAVAVEPDQLMVD